MLRLGTVLVVISAACGDDGGMPVDGGRDTGGPDTGASDGGNTDGGGGGMVSFTVGPDAPAMVAARDGDGAFTVVTAGAGGVYRFAVTGARYGIAIGCGTDAYATVSIVEATVAETTSPSLDCTVPGAGDTIVRITGTVTGVMTGQTAQVEIAGRSAMITDVGSRSYELMVPMGVRDVFARRRDGAGLIDRIIRRNDVMLEEGAVVDFDFTTEGFAPESHTVTFEGLSASEPDRILNIFLNGGGSPFGMGPFTDGSYLALPGSELRGEDIHSVTAGTAVDDFSTFRNVRRLFVQAMDFTSAPPPLPPMPTIDAAGTTPYLIVRGTVASPLAADVYRFQYTQRRTGPDRTRVWVVTLTSGFVQSAAVTAYALPDLSALGGFDASWGLAAGLETQWQVFTESSDDGVADLLDADQTAAELDGKRYETAQRLGRITL